MYTFIGILLIIGLIYLFGWIIKPIYYAPGLVVGIIIGLLLNAYENDIMAALTLFFVFIYPIITFISKRSYTNGVTNIIVPYTVTCPRCNKDTVHTSYVKRKSDVGLTEYYEINMCYNDDCKYYHDRKITHYEWSDNVEQWKIKHPN